MNKTQSDSMSSSLYQDSMKPNKYGNSLHALNPRHYIDNQSPPLKKLNSKPFWFKVKQMNVFCWHEVQFAREFQMDHNRFETPAIQDMTTKDRFHYVYFGKLNSENLDNDWVMTNETYLVENMVWNATLKTYISNSSDFQRIKVIDIMLSNQKTSKSRKSVCALIELL